MVHTTERKCVRANVFFLSSSCEGRVELGRGKNFLRRVKVELWNTKARYNSKGTTARNASQVKTFPVSAEDEFSAQSEGEHLPVEGNDEAVGEGLSRMRSPKGRLRRTSAAGLGARNCPGESGSVSSPPWSFSRTSRLDFEAIGACLVHDELWDRGLAAPLRRGGDTPRNVVGGEELGRGAAKRDRSSAIPASMPVPSSLQE